MYQCVYTLQISCDKFSLTVVGFPVTEGLVTSTKAPPTPKENFTIIAIQPKQVWNCVVSFNLHLFPLKPEQNSIGVYTRRAYVPVIQNKYYIKLLAPS